MDAPPAKRQKQKYDYKAEARGEIRRKDPIDSTADGLKGRSNAGEGRAEVAGDDAAQGGAGDHSCEGPRAVYADAPLKEKPLAELKAMRESFEANEGLPPPPGA